MVVEPLIQPFLWLISIEFFCGLFGVAGAAKPDGRPESVCCVWRPTLFEARWALDPDALRAVFEAFNGADFSNGVVLG